ncbi:MAG: hypothetical protein A3F84_16080 [Candidatus Handelsmanbacteria bacterium RIFCSPLOWO2_12_FULL_64_10]|uniref:ABC3 transporter permease protein domain-containing protein n=1 Tax=Handelsmanbacteria sp. (strain RIFCSPLOWO2_12_FULL_64_10) TaxID=1817868 RepID=A0A1F6D3U9_HANXR|nr:MAG: hypothetical protein A3F84_16080 [Candidatus Handelsmanbacteria bacterium RIFCSPLOWO2_12_FULL_64_10]
MFKNYLTVAFRNLLRHRVHSAINIAGLAVGIAFCILTFLYVRHEWSYDTFHKNADSIYRVYRVGKRPDGEKTVNGGTQYPVGPALQAHFPEVRQMVRFERSRATVTGENRSFPESVVFTDPAVFEMFSFPLLRGNPETALKDKSAVVISEEMAQKYFGDQDPIGKRLSIRRGRGGGFPQLQSEAALKGKNWTPVTGEFGKLWGAGNAPPGHQLVQVFGDFYDFTITGVARNTPDNSSIRFDFLLPYENIKDLTGIDINSWSVYPRNSTYVQLSEGVLIPDLETKFSRFIEKFTNRYQLRLQPLIDIHLNPAIPGPEPMSSPQYAYVLSGISLFVLLIACVNFINLAVGRSSTRAREVGIRKVGGASRAQLMRQFWGESVLLTFIALCIGIALAELLLPAFNGLTGKHLALTLYANGPALAFLIGLNLFVGVAAGLYPALILTGFHPVVVLRGRLKVGSPNLLGRGLVVLQFALSIFFIVSALLMNGQVRFLKGQDLGFHREQIVVIPNKGLIEPERKRLFAFFKNELARHDEIAGVTGATHLFNQVKKSKFQQQDGKMRDISSLGVDYDYLDMFGLELKEGRNFSRDQISDATKATIVNETLVKAFEWDSALGKTYRGHPGTYGVIAMGANFVMNPKIIGVVKDFHVESLHHEIVPLALYLEPAPEYLFIKIRPNRIPSALALLKDTWRQAAPSLPLDFFFLDEYVDRQYRAEERWGQIIGYASVFAVFIACLGAFGLTALAVARRTKEIGIRKVLGASVPSLLALLSGEFVVLVTVANLVAWPAAYYAMNRWLQDFAYRIPLGVGPFILGGVLTLVVSLLTVNIQAMKAARANPVEALRYE